MTAAETERRAGPLPQPTPATAEFWASGGDGVLRVKRCGRCGLLSHPTAVVCRDCRSFELVMAPVSGRAVVVGHTVNMQAWTPAFPPPYVIAIVALEEDADVRLTTRIVGCEVDGVEVGTRVRVTFEQAADDVWLPLFTPDPDLVEQPGPVPGPPAGSPVIRPPARSDRFEHRVAVTGVGQSRIGRRLMLDPVHLTVEAALAAVEDAGLRLEDIDGLSTYPGAGAGGITEGGVMPIEQALRIQPTWVNGGGDLPGQNGAIVAAMLAVSAGLCRHVLCLRTVWESTHTQQLREGRWDAGTPRATGMMEFRLPFGAMSAANWIACQASHYAHWYGDIKPTLGAIAVGSRANAAQNPEAVYRDPLSLDDYMDARMVSTPFGLYDCDVPVDGAVAVIVSAADAAEDTPAPVMVEAVGTQITEPLSWDQGTLTHLPQSQGPAAHLWTRTDLRPGDVDVALLYDGFTFNALSWLEGLGFCGPGQARDFIDGGRGIAIDGHLPLNPHGGQLSAGRTHGFGFFREAVLQLRGRAPGLQVADARVAVVTAGGGVPSGAVLLRAP